MNVSQKTPEFMPVRPSHKVMILEMSDLLEQLQEQIVDGDSVRLMTVGSLASMAVALQSLTIEYMEDQVQTPVSGAERSSFMEKMSEALRATAAGSMNLSSDKGEDSPMTQGCTNPDCIAAGRCMGGADLMDDLMEMSDSNEGLGVLPWPNDRRRPMGMPRVRVFNMSPTGSVEMGGPEVLGRPGMEGMEGLEGLANVLRKMAVRRQQTPEASSVSAAEKSVIAEQMAKMAADLGAVFKASFMKPEDDESAVTAYFTSVMDDLKVKINQMLEMGGSAVAIKAMISSQIMSRMAPEEVTAGIEKLRSVH